MYYVIQFSKPTSADKKLSEQFPNKSALARWECLIKNNGYTVDKITKVRKIGTK